MTVDPEMTDVELLLAVHAADLDTGLLDLLTEVVDRGLAESARKREDVLIEEILRLRGILSKVLKAPVRFQGSHVEPWRKGMTEEENRNRGVIRYTAKEIRDELMAEIREAVGS